MISYHHTFWYIKKHYINKHNYFVKQIFQGLVYIVYWNHKNLRKISSKELAGNLSSFIAIANVIQ